MDFDLTSADQEGLRQHYAKCISTTLSEGGVIESFFCLGEDRRIIERNITMFFSVAYAQIKELGLVYSRFAEGEIKKAYARRREMRLDNNRADPTEAQPHMEVVQISLCVAAEQMPSVTLSFYHSTKQFTYIARDDEEVVHPTCTISSVLTNDQMAYDHWCDAQIPSRVHRGCTDIRKIQDTRTLYIQKALIASKPTHKPASKPTPKEDDFIIPSNVSHEANIQHLFKT